MHTTMMTLPLSVNHFLDRAGTLFKHNPIVSRLPDKTLRTHSYGQWAQRTRALGAALQALGLKQGERVATLSWNHHAHLEAYFGIPAAGGVMHTLNLRLSPDELGWIAADAQDRFLIVDDILLPLYRQFAHLHAFERVIVFPFSGAPVPAEFTDYEALLAGADADSFVYAAHAEDDPIAMCYTSGTTGRPKGVAYSHRSTVLHTLVASLGDHWCLRGTDVVCPVTPMFHANCWGLPYGAVMLGVKLVFPGPHLHPEDLLDLFTQQPPTLSLGVPTIWMTMIQAYERSLAEQPGRWALPAGMRSLVGGAAVPVSLIQAFARHGVQILQGWGMTETSPLATVGYPRAEKAGADEAERFRQAALAGTPAPLVEIRLRTDEGALAPWDGTTMGEIQVRGNFITGSYHQVPVAPDKFSDDGCALKPGQQPPADVLAMRLNEHLMAHGFAKWQCPDRYELIPQVPRTSTGKFWKLKLREMFPG
ncbi:MAG: long-chain fatty acid--CoA ligase [Burkholderiales bacterium PBB5]|nr:MAG: long-chain fatty acid--CoA ligase [Burkholderiales bacterium PBB5]